MMFKALIASTAALATVAAGCSPEPPPPASTNVEVSGVYISEPAMGERAAMYFTIKNGTDDADELLGVSTPVAAVTEIHQTIQEGGMVRMEPVSSLTLPAGGELRLAPGGYHVMLLELQEEFAPGDWVDATLHFRQAGEVTIRGRVLKYVDIEKALTENQ